MKSKVLVSSILTIALCLSLIAGSTFALFTSNSENNIAVQAAKVKMAATIDNLALTSVRPATVAEIRAAKEGDKSVNIIEDEFGGQYVYIDCENGTFPNGGTATFENAKLSLNCITPGDKVSFDIVGSNTSDVDIQYRYVIECFDGQKLMSGLLVSIDGVTYEYLGAYTSGWKTLKPGTDMDTVPVVIDFPVNKGNEFQEESTSIRVVVEAVQGNADVTGSNEPTAEFLDNLNLDLSGKSMPIPAGVVNTGNLTLANGAIAIDQVGLENTGNATLTNMVIDGGTPGRVAYGYSVIGRGENSVTVLNDVTVNSANGAISAADGAQVTFNGGSVEVNSASTSGRYLFYASGEGTVITINDGNFDFNKTQNQKRAYICAIDGATVYVTGGTFGKASTSNNKILGGKYSDGIITDATGTVIITGGTFGFNPSAWVAPGFKALQNGSQWMVLPENYDVVVNNADQLQAALDAATGEYDIYVNADIVGNVKVTQKENTKITIDGNDHIFNGVMTVFGNGGKKTAGLTIKDVNFVAAAGADSCIVSPARAENNNVLSNFHNLTVEGCTFTDPDGIVNCAAVRQRSAGDTNWKIIDCTVDSTMHSLAQMATISLGVGADDGLLIQGCEVYSKNGINLKQCTKVSIVDCKIDVKGYAVRYGVDTSTINGNFEIVGSDLKSANDDGDAVIIFRGNMAGSTLTITDTDIVGTPDITGNANVVYN